MSEITFLLFFFFLGHYPIIDIVCGNNQNTYAMSESELVCLLARSDHVGVNSLYSEISTAVDYVGPRGEAYPDIAYHIFSKSGTSTAAPV